jgi:hypothetical protein
MNVRHRPSKLIFVGPFGVQRVAILEIAFTNLSTAGAHRASISAAPV